MLLGLFVKVPSEAVLRVEAPSVDALLVESPPDVTATEDVEGSALETWLPQCQRFRCQSHQCWSYHYLHQRLGPRPSWYRLSNRVGHGDGLAIDEECLMAQLRISTCVLWRNSEDVSYLQQKQRITESDMQGRAVGNA